jgi:hypothetical protein
MNSTSQGPLLNKAFRSALMSDSVWVGCTRSLEA